MMLARLVVGRKPIIAVALVLFGLDACGTSKPNGRNDGGTGGKGGKGGIGGAGGSAGSNDAGSGGAGGSAACDVDAGGRLAPYPTQFRLHNDSNAAMFLHEGCVGIDFDVSSCSSGFQDRLGPAFHCGCDCESPSCTSQPQCGACPPPAAVIVPAGGQVTVSWSGVYVADAEKPRPSGMGQFTCVTRMPLAAGRYRFAIRVYSQSEGAVGEVGGATVTTDFNLPSTDDIVDVSLAPTTPDGSVSASTAQFQ